MARRAAAGATTDRAGPARAITIDDKECHRLGLLLEQIFKGASIEMITTVINPRGKYRAGTFARSEEYVYFIMLGDAMIAVSLTSTTPKARTSRGARYVEAT